MGSVTHSLSFLFFVSAPSVSFLGSGFSFPSPFSEAEDELQMRCDAVGQPFCRPRCAGFFVFSTQVAREKYEFLFIAASFPLDALFLVNNPSFPLSAMRFLFQYLLLSP